MKRRSHLRLVVVPDILKQAPTEEGKGARNAPCSPSFHSARFFYHHLLLLVFRERETAQQWLYSNFFLFRTTEPHSHTTTTKMYLFFTNLNCCYRIILHFVLQYSRQYHRQ